MHHEEDEKIEISKNSRRNQVKERFVDKKL
jgi:hypothetical protein